MKYPLTCSLLLASEHDGFDCFRLRGEVSLELKHLVVACRRRAVPIQLSMLDDSRSLYATMR
jgi:hypothetical protein